MKTWLFALALALAPIGPVIAQPASECHERPETKEAALARVRAIVDKVASEHGETRAEFYRRLGSTEAKVAAFALAAEACGPASIEDAIRSLDSMSQVLHPQQ